MQAVPNHLLLLLLLLRTPSLWVRNVQMALFSTPMAALTMVLAEGAEVRRRGPWAGFNRWLVATIALGALGGIPNAQRLVMDRAPAFANQTRAKTIFPARARVRVRPPRSKRFL